MDAHTLMLTDARFPGGGHAHSGGLEEAASQGLLRAEADLPSFLIGRLRTAGELAAIFAAAAAHTAAAESAPAPMAATAPAATPAAAPWSTLDAELDARTPSAAQRAASRAQGRALARAALALPEGRHLQPLLAATPHPHHAIALGALLGAGGGSPADAALAAAYLSVSGPASASVRLLGLDPLRVNAIVWSLTPQLHVIAGRAAAHADRPPADLPAPSAPGLDLLAEAHHRKEVRLFAS